MGGINYLLSSLLKHFYTEVGADEGKRLLTAIATAATNFVSSLSLTPGQTVPILKDNNRQYGFDPFFIETGGMVLTFIFFTS